MSETIALFVLASVHFINLVDFMMVMPMGPDFASALGIPMSRLGIIGGSYTATATVVGILGSIFLDRFERRAALTLCVAGLGLSTAAGGVATGAGTLILSRVAAGSFGGLAASLCFSIVGDLVSEERRGRATALVASGYSIAAIFGVPAGLELSRRGGWRAPFWIVGATAVALAALVRLILPRLGAHIKTGARPERLSVDAKMGWVFLAFGCTIVGNFLLVPNLSAYLQFNLSYPREGLGMLYMLGGAASLVTMRLAGVWIDRVGGASSLVLFCTVLVSGALTAGIMFNPPFLAPLAFFTIFMGFNSARWVAINTVAMTVPPPSARARFFSAQNAFSHASSAVAAFASSAFLSADSLGRLSGMGALTVAAVAASTLAPLAIWRLERSIGRVPPAAELD